MILSDAPELKWDCGTCKAEDRCESRNCFEVGPFNTYYDHLMPGLRMCPISVVPAGDFAWELVRQWQEWKLLQLLPYEGDLNDQPQWVCETFEICERVLADVQEKQHKKALKDAEGPPRRTDGT